MNSGRLSGVLGTRDAHRRIWRLAGPIILSNLTIPFLGLVDTAVMGHLPSPEYLGAVALGALVFSYIYWGFGFLRMGTTGLAAQAWGRDNIEETVTVYYRGLALALLLGTIIVLLQVPIIAGSFALTEASQKVEAFGASYVAIRIWGAPAALANYVVLGWFLGLQDARTPLILQIVINGVNIVLDIVFVLGFGWGVEGVAAATLIAEATGAVLGGLLVWRRIAKFGGVGPSVRMVFQWREFKYLIALNADILIRTLCLTTAFALFTAKGAEFNDVILAANAVLLNFLQFTAYGLDGFAHAAEALVGRAKGRGDGREFREAAKTAFVWGAIVSLLMTVFYLAAGRWIIDLLTTIPEVRQSSYTYLVWPALLPILSVWCFVFDGIFLGATRSAALRNAMVLSLVGYVITLWLLAPQWQNHGLWAALSFFMVLRAITLWVAYPALLRSINET